MKIQTNIYDYNPILSGEKGCASIDTYADFLYKLFCSEPFEMSKDEDVLYIDKLKEQIPFFKYALPLYAAVFSGGAFREQFSYLGCLGGVDAKTRMSSLRQCIYRINRYYDDDIVMNKTVDIGSHKGSYIFLSESGIARINESLANFNIVATTPLVNKHSSSLEHASGYADLLFYLVGNRHYPTKFKLLSEDMINEVDKLNSFIVADAVCTTLSCDGLNDAYTIDYVEFHTGTQHAKAVADKLAAYTKQLIVNTRQAGGYISDNILFLIHPKGSCANRSAGRKGQVDNISDEEVYSKTFLCCYLGISNNLNTLGDLRSFLDVQVLNDYKDIVTSVTFTKLTTEQIRGFHNDIARFIDRLSLNSSTVGADTPIRAFIAQLDSTRKQHSDDEFVANLYKRSYASANDILNKSIRIFSKDYSSLYTLFRELCLNGLSVSTCFGIDMYESYLTVHPLFTGAADAVMKMLIRSHCLSPGIEYIGAAGRPVSEIGGQLEVLGNRFFLKNMCVYSNSSKTGTGRVFIENVSTDIGGQIRIANLLGTPNASALADTRVVCLVDSIEDAYMFLATKVDTLSKEASGSLASFSHLQPLLADAGTGNLMNDCYLLMHNTSALGLPIFILKEDIINTMAGNVGAVQGPFVFLDTSFYTAAFVSFTNAKIKGGGFAKFFRRELRDNQEDFFKDILFLPGNI